MSSGKDLKRGLNKLLGNMKPFKPTKEQLVLKSRLSDHIGEMSAVVDVTVMGLDELTQLTGSRNLAKWAKDNPSFLPWLLDKDYGRHMIKAGADAAIELLYDIMEAPIVPKELTAKDKLVAATTFLNLDDRFPNKRKELVFLDKEVGDLTDIEVAKQLQQYKKELASLE